MEKEDRGGRDTGEDSGPLEERVVEIYESVNQLGFVSGPLLGMRENPTARHTRGQRSKPGRTMPLRVVTMCLGMLCLMLLGAVIGLTVHYNSASTILTLERNRLRSSYDNLILWMNQSESNYNKLTEENDKLQREVNQLTAGTSCLSGWQRFGCSCYYRSNELKTWDASRQQCKKIGADLVIINSKEEQEFVRGLGSGTEVSWIGLSKMDGKWTWVDGTPLTTGYWNSGWPADSKGHNCTQHWYSLDPGQWTNAQCANTYSWMCEKK